MAKGTSLPSYLKLEESEFKERVERLRALLDPCFVCPRACGAHRLKDETGECGMGSNVIVSSYGPHFGEEPVLVGRNGSGTVFFSGCNLHCLYCQNYEISQLRMGTVVCPEELATIFLKVQQMRCHNLNLVTPSHVVPRIVEGLFLASKKGFRLPIVYNTSSYDSVRVLKLLEGIVDIYMPDIKYSSDEIASKYSQVENYTRVSRKAIGEMHRQVGDLVIEEGIAVRGLLIRHLVLPNDLSGSKDALAFIASLSRESYVNIMDQYHPTYGAFDFPELRRRITRGEYLEVVDMARRLGLHRGIPFDFL